jgi:hypothetical protein
MAACNYVHLKGGLAVPVAPLLLALEMERRGISLRRDGEDLVVRPWSQVTEAERAALRRWKHHVLAIIAYEAPEVA